MTENKHFIGKYRKDIQILRGISVLLVVLFHLEVGGFKSGFLGVDVFFVISGYLMAVLYKPERKIEFYKKRINRLLPAYFAVILATLLVAMLRTTPNDFGAVTKQGIFAAFFTSNIGFWLENSYFSKSAFNPLLHLWSLGVEIQFYLLIPLLYWVFHRIKGSYWLILLGSLGACFFVVGISPKTSFFMVPFRLWEFLLGYGVAGLLAKKTSNQATAWSWLGAAGLVILTAIPMIKVDGQAENFVFGHPGLSALGVCVATSIILLVGLPPVLENLKIATLLEKLGQYSYSIYLVHFPLIVLFLYRPFSGTILKTSESWQTPVLALSIIVLSSLMYFLIEEPFRVHPKTPRRLILAGLSVLLLGPLGGYYQRLQIPEQEMNIYQAWTDRAPYRCGKLIRIIEPSAITCELTQGLSNPVHRVLLAGNSHADSLKATFASVAQQKNISVRFLVDNEPLMQGGMSPATLVDEAVAKHIDTIVLHFSPGAITADKIAKVAELASSKNIAVSYIMPVPVWKQHVPLALWKNLKQHAPLPAATLVDYRKLNHDLRDDLSSISSGNFKLYDIAGYFCAENANCSVMDSQGRPLYFDDGHLTLTGSEVLRGLFSQILTNLDQPVNQPAITQR